MSLNTFDEVDQAVIDDCFCRYTGEEIKALIRERNQAMAERDELLAALKSIIELPWLDLLDNSHIERCQQAERLVAKLEPRDDE